MVQIKYTFITLISGFQAAFFVSMRNQNIGIDSGRSRWIVHNFNHSRGFRAAFFMPVRNQNNGIDSGHSVLNALVYQRRIH